MRNVIAIEEHWTTDGIDRALRSRPVPSRDESVALNDSGDIPERLLDIGERRIAAMDAAGVDLQVLSIAPPGTHGLPAREAIALSREANDRAAEAVSRYPTRLRAMTTLPMSDPDAAVAELERTANAPAHVGIMSYGRSGDRPLDDPAYDELLATAAALRRPVFIHPQIPPNAVRDASYRGFDPTVELALATFGWGWHMEAGLAALRLILRGTFDRHPDLQIVLGHWGEMLLFALDRVDSLSNVATGLDRRVAEYVRTNVHIATSGMLTPRLLRHALDFTSVDRILLSGDYPFHRLDTATLADFLGTLPDREDQHKIAYANAQALFRLEPSPSGPDGGTAPIGSLTGSRRSAPPPP
ncbi:amidohydrolase family protein [Streptomyces sp. S465]|uniref:amidohydrolase family protein n=1 Tax=Streptomyces sp. S465 TaxID=2979468 RepID=UPI0022A8A6BC|nr:amidohydrolase family protein [Streptomyces sp. S465]WAP55942.1 amidohydrolase family protein [Streptomyces sp. S465]